MGHFILEIWWNTYGSFFTFCSVYRLDRQFLFKFNSKLTFISEFKKNIKSAVASVITAKDNLWKKFSAKAIYQPIDGGKINEDFLENKSSSSWLEKKKKEVDFNLNK